MNPKIKEALRKVIKKHRSRKQQPWQEPGFIHSWVNPLGGNQKVWQALGKDLVRTMEGLKDQGVGKPLGRLQDAAFDLALRDDAPPVVTTIALWLTDTRLRVDALKDLDGDEKQRFREQLIERGIIKAKKN